MASAWTAVTVAVRWCAARLSTVHLQVGMQRATGRMCFLGVRSNALAWRECSTTSK